MKAVMMNGYFKDKEVDLASPVPLYKFMLPSRNNNITDFELTFENLAKFKPTIAIYKRAIVTKRVAYYKFSHYE